MFASDSKMGAVFIRALRVMLATVALVTSIVLPTGAAVATPHGDCTDPAGWAAANGAVVVELTETTPVAVLFNRSGPYAVVGSNAGDVILGSLGGDLICGRGGRDIIWSGGGNDIIDGGGGRDILLAGPDVDSCSTDDLDVVRECESVERVSSSIDVATVTAVHLDKRTTNTGSAPLVPVLSCVRERSDGMMEAVLGHRTQVAESFYGLFREVDENLLPTNDIPLPQFFYEGDHPHTVAVPFDPTDPPRLWLEPSDFRFLNSRQWRFDIQLGSGLPVCAADVPAVLPIIGEIYPGGGDPFEASFVGSFPIFLGGPDFHYFRVEPTATSACTGAAATPVAPEFNMLFRDLFGVAALTPSQIEGTLGGGYVVSNTPVRRFTDSGSSSASASVVVSADLYPSCRLPDGSVVVAENPVWFSANDETFVSVGATYTPGSDPPATATFVATVALNSQSGFSRFR